MTEYTFTAFAEDDLLNAGDNNLGSGDVFTMPGSASVTFTVNDNDAFLSGDNWSNENANDSSGQTASITAPDGTELGNGGQIYAESYLWVYDQYGNWYIMIEIEQEGTGDDYFTFYNGYGYSTPDEGLTLTVHSVCNVTCDWIDFTCLDAPPVVQPEPENQAPIAEDDAYSGQELATITGNILTNDSDPDGDPIILVDVDGRQPGESIQVTTELGFTGTVTVQQDGSFTFEPDAGFEALAAGQQDSFQLNYTITDDPTATVKHNLLFVLDISNSTVGAGGGNNVFDGAGVGDVNGDGVANTVLDAEIAAVISAVNSLIADGVDPADIDIGIVTFSGIASGFASVDAETLGTFSLDDGNLMNTLMGIQSGGWTNYEAGLQQAEAWFASQQGDGAANKMMFLSDGRPIIGYDYDAGQYITQGPADYGDEVQRIAGDYNAEIYGIGVGANSDLDYLNDLDNTGGAERVLDAATLNVVLENAVAQPLTDSATITVTINGVNQLSDGDEASEVCETDNTVQLINVLDNTYDPEAGDPIVYAVWDQNGPMTGNVGQEIEGTNGGVFVINEDGSATFNDNGAFDYLDDGQSATTSITYCVKDAAGQIVESTYTVTVNGKDNTIEVVADDDCIVVTEDEGAGDIETLDGGATSILANDTENGSAYTGDVIEVNGIAGNVGQWIDLDKGRVLINSDGTVDFDADGDFEALGNGESEALTVNYTIGSEAQANTQNNVLLVIDISNSTVGLDGQNVFDGTGVGDVNNDGRADTVLDAQIVAAKALVADLRAQGVDPALVNVGIVTFSGVDTTGASSYNDATVDSEVVGTFNLGDAGIEAALDSILSGSWTNYEAGLSEAETWFNDHASANDANSMYFLSDGRPITSFENGAYVEQDPSQFLDEVARIEANFGTDIHAIGVGANSSLGILNQIDNTGGAVQVTDAASLTAALLEGSEIITSEDSATVTIKVQGVNDLEDGDEAETVGEDSGATTFVVGALDNTVDPEAGTPAVTEITNGAATVAAGNQIAGDNGGLFTIAGDGTVTFDTNGDFESLNDGESTTTQVTYTVQDAAGDTVTSTHTVTVNGADDAPQISLSGNVQTEGAASRSLTFVIDHSISTFGNLAAGVVDDLNGDGMLTVIDAILEQVVDAVQGLDASQQVNFILAGLTGAVAEGSITAGAIQGAAGAADPSAALAALLGPIYDQPAGTESELDIAKALEAAKAKITATNANGEDIDDIIVLTTTTSVGDFDFDPVTGEITPLPFTDPAPVLAALTDAAGINADVDVVLIDSDATAFPQVLESVDADGITDNVTNADSFGLDSLISPDGTVSLGQVVSVSIDGMEFVVSDEDPAADGFQFTVTGLATDPTTGAGVKLNIDEDGDLTTIERVEDVTSLITSTGADSFEFNFDLG